MADAREIKGQSEDDARAPAAPEGAHSQGLESLLAQLDARLGEADGRSRELMGEVLDRLDLVASEQRLARAAREAEDALTYQRIESAIGVLARRRQGADATQRNLRADDGPWDAMEAEAFTRMYETHGLAAPRTDDERGSLPREPAPHEPHSPKQDDLEAEVPALNLRLTEALTDLPNATDMQVVLQRLDHLDKRFDEVFEHRDQSPAAISSRLLDAQVEELLGAFRDMSGQLGRIETLAQAIPAPAAEVSSIIVDPQFGADLKEAARATLAVDSLYAFVERHFHEQRLRDEQTAVALTSLQQAITDVLDRAVDDRAVEIRPTAPAAPKRGSNRTEQGTAPANNAFDDDELFEPLLPSCLAASTSTREPRLDGEDAPASTAEPISRLSRDQLIASAKRAARLASSRPAEPDQAPSARRIRGTLSVPPTLSMLIVGICAGAIAFAAVLQLPQGRSHLQHIAYTAWSWPEMWAASRVAAGDAAEVLSVAASDFAAINATQSEAIETATVEQRSPLTMPPAGLGPASLRLAAQRGDPRAQFEVAARFAEGKGIEQNLAEAFRWYEYAAQSGHVPAQYRLATFHERGLGTQSDLALARSWYEAAAQAGHPQAMHNLATLLAGSRGTDVDYAAAARWFGEAAAKGLSESQFNLAMLYEGGLGVPQSAEQAFLWYALAARHGDANAARRRDSARSLLDAETVKRVERSVAGWRPGTGDGALDGPVPAAWIGAAPNSAG